MKHVSLFFVASLSVAGLCFGACGGKRQDPEIGNPPPQQCPPGQYFDGRYCVTQGGPTPTASHPAPTPTATTTATAPVPTATPGPSATPLDPTAAAAAVQALDVIAKSSAPAGARAVSGTAMAGQFQTGQSLEVQLQAQPGKCYTVVGAGLPPVANLDLSIVATAPVPGFGSPILGQDKTSAPNAVVGEKPNCFKWAAPVAAPLRVVMTVSAGQGVAAAQVYAK